MKTIKRWIKNVKWLLNHPPTTMTEGPPLKCDYCHNFGKDRGGTNTISGLYTICGVCQKAVYDATLKGKQDD